MSASLTNKPKLSYKDRASAVKLTKSNQLNNDLQQLKTDLFEVIKIYEPRVRTIYQDASQTKTKLFRDEERIHGPVINLVLESSQKTFVKAFYWKHFPLNGRSLQIIVNYCEKFFFLNTLRLENSNLQEPDVQVLANFLRSNANVTDLNLNGNEYKENFSLLLLETRLKYISLKFCGITGKKLAELIQPLKFAYQHPLLYLNLANNNIGDEGAVEIANMLRVNRILISVNLSCNKITDIGAETILKCFKSFELNQEEISMRRKIYYAYYMKKYEQDLASATYTIREIKSKPSTCSTRDRRYSKLKGQNKKHSKSRTSLYEVSPTSLSKTKTNDNVPPNPEDSPPLPYPAMSDLVLVLDFNSAYHPFIKDVIIDDMKFTCRGNFNLRHLNFSFNLLTAEMLKVLHDVLSYQNSNGSSEDGLKSVTFFGNNMKNYKYEDIQIEIEGFFAVKMDRPISSNAQILKDSYMRKDKRRSSKN